jgi:hypothetical protein
MAFPLATIVAAVVIPPQEVIMTAATVMILTSMMRITPVKVWAHPAALARVTTRVERFRATFLVVVVEAVEAVGLVKLATRIIRVVARAIKSRTG